MATRWSNSRADFTVSESPVRSQPSTTVPMNNLIRRGTRGKLGKILEKMHSGEVLSQHEVSSALSEYNQMVARIAELEHRTKHLKLQVSPEDAILPAPRPDRNGSQETDTSRANVDKMADQLRRKDLVIADLQKRVQRLSHESSSKVNFNVNVADIAPPGRIVDNFCDLYEKEWSYAYEVLKSSMKDEERVLFTLFRVVRHAYIFCYDMAASQRTAVEDYSAKLQEAMLHPVFIHPTSNLKYKPSLVTTKETQQYTDVGRKLISDYRSILVTQSIPGVQELFRKIKLPEIFATGIVNNAVHKFVNRTVELVWLMVVQDPPMHLYWLEPRQTNVPYYFSFFDDKGSYVKQTVWPAVFTKENGTILSKGVILAARTLDECD